MNWEHRNQAPPTNLCPYVRFTISTMLFMAICASVTGVVGFSAGQTIQMFWYGSSTDGPMAAIGAIFWFVVVVLGLIYTIVTICRAMSMPNIIETMVDNIEAYYENKEPSLFVEWLKAKHDKICPVIHFVDAPPPIGTVWTDTDNGEVKVFTGTYWFPFEPNKGDTVIQDEVPMVFDGEAWIYDEVVNPFDDPTYVEIMGAGPFDDFAEKVEEEKTKLGIDKNDDL